MDGQKKLKPSLCYETKKSQQIESNKDCCTLLPKEETMNTWTKTGMVDKPPLGRARFVLSLCLGWKLESCWATEAESILSKNVVSESVLSKSVGSEDCMSVDIESESILSQRNVIKSVLSQRNVTKCVLSHSVMSESVMSESVTSCISVLESNAFCNLAF